MKNRENVWAIVKTVILGLISLAFLLPLAWMITSSLKNTNEVFSVNWKWFPEIWRWDNYVTVWTDPDVSMLTSGSVHTVT